MNSALAIQPTCSDVAAPLSFPIPIPDMPEFMELTQARRVEIHVALEALQRLHQTIPVEGKMKALKSVAALYSYRMRGLSDVTLGRKYKAYLAGGWRRLIKGYKGPNEQPDEFVEELRRVIQTNFRSKTEAVRQLRERWANGEAIPGYGTWMDHYVAQFPDRPLPKTWPRNFYPVGWSLDNLCEYGPSKGSRTLYQRGFAAAKKHFPSLKRDPSGLRPLELIVIDDFWSDCNVVWPGDAEIPAQIAMVKGLMAMDVGTRRKLVWGMGPSVMRDGKRVGIRRIDVQHLLFQLFQKYGLPEYPVTILCENATASISSELELVLSTLFEGRVRVERTGMINHKTLTNGFLDGGGMPWQKGWIESLFNKLWNILGSQKGYKGSNERLNAPGGLAEARAYALKFFGRGINEKAYNLTPEEIQMLHLPFPSPEELEKAFAWACDLIDERTDHKYIGFREVTEYLLADGTEPQDFSALAHFTEEQQRSVTPISRMESTVERWTRLAREANLQPVPESVLALLLLTPKKIAWSKYSFSFAHENVGYSYVDKAGVVMKGIQEGTEFLVYFDPKNPSQAHVADLRGAYMGTLDRLGGRTGAVDIRDKEALGKWGGVQRAIIDRVDKENADRHSAQNEQLAADRAHNDAIVAIAQLTRAERIAAAIAQTKGTAPVEVKPAAAAKTVSAQAAGKGLESLVQDTCTDETSAVTADQDDAEAGDDTISLSDL